MNRSQTEINQSEWKDENNWSTIYFSKKDTRSWVPKKNPAYGVTINFGSKIGSRWIYYLFLFYFLLGLSFGIIFGEIL